MGDFRPVLGECWISIVDGGAALGQHWVGFSFLLGTRVVDMSLILFLFIVTQLKPTYKPLSCL